MDTTSNRGLDVPAAIRRLWPMLLALLIVGFVLGLLASALQPVSYTARAELVVVSSAQVNARDAAVGEELAISRAQTYAMLGTSAAVASEAADQLGGDNEGSKLLQHISVESGPDLPTLAISAKAPDAAQARALAAAWVTALQASAARLDAAGGASDSDESDQNVQIVQVGRGELPADSSRIATPVMAAAGVGLGLLLAASVVLYYGATRRRLTDLSAARQTLPTIAWIDLGAAQYRQKRWGVSKGSEPAWREGISKLEGWLLDAPASHAPNDELLAVGTHAHSAATLVASSLGSGSLGVRGIVSADSPALFDTARGGFRAILVVDELSTADGVRDAYLGVQAVGATVIGATFVHSGSRPTAGLRAAGSPSAGSN